jgi:beta-phosphoglucomutase family hydrolase
LSIPVPSPVLPGLEGYHAVLFDLDGVLTPTADIHMHAWRKMFTEVFAEKDAGPPYTDADYYTYLDGKQRFEGVAGMLASRGIDLPAGDAGDPPTADTVHGVGNRKNAVFTRVLEEEGIDPYPGSLALVDQLVAERMPVAVVSSSKNATWVLTAAGMIDRFPVIVDGLVGERAGLASKPAPDMFLYAAKAMGVEPSRAAVFEDAISGVAAAHAGGFGLVVGVDRGVGEAALTAAGADVVIGDLAVYVGVPR